jgi:hypothetical protein
LFLCLPLVAARAGRYKEFFGQILPLCSSVSFTFLYQYKGKNTKKLLSLSKMKVKITLVQL